MIGIDCVEMPLVVDILYFCCGFLTGFGRCKGKEHERIPAASLCMRQQGAC